MAAPRLRPFDTASRWQMALGERVAVEGVLSQLKPGLAVEVGTAQGGSLNAIAAHAVEVHSIDLNLDLNPAAYPNVTFHSGDSRVLLPRLLDELASAGRNIDFVLLDGDHSRRGVRRDLQHVLESPAARNTIVLLHDMMNTACRAGVTGIGLGAYPKVAYVDLDLVPNVRRAPVLQERWGGLGLIVIEESTTNYRVFDDTILHDTRTSPAHELVRDAAAPLRGALRVLHAGRRRLARGLGRASASPPVRSRG